MVGEVTDPIGQVTISDRYVLPYLSVLSCGLTGSRLSGGSWVDTGMQFRSSILCQPQFGRLAVVVGSW